MTTISLIGAPVETGQPAPNLRPAVPVLSAAGVNDAATIARQQLLSAPPAPALIAAYAASIQPQQKPLARAATQAPSSALAAQFIAQDSSLTEADLAIFVPAKPATNLPADNSTADSYLADMRIARGEVAGAPTLRNAEPQKNTVESNAVAAVPIGTGIENVARNGLGQAVVAFPMLLIQRLRRADFVKAQGVVAYQFAQARNAASRKPTVAEAN